MNNADIDGPSYFHSLTKPTYCAIPNKVLTWYKNGRLSAATVRVYLALCSHGHDQRRECRLPAQAPISTLARWAGISRDEATRALHQLEQAGLIRCETVRLIHTDLPEEEGWFPWYRYPGMDSIVSQTRTLIGSLLVLAQHGYRLETARSTLQREAGLDASTARRDLRLLRSLGWGVPLGYGFRLTPPAQNPSPDPRKILPLTPPRPAQNPSPIHYWKENSTKLEEQNKTPAGAQAPPGVPGCLPVSQGGTPPEPLQPVPPPDTVCQKEDPMRKKPPIPTHEAYALVEWALRHLGCPVVTPTSRIGRLALRACYARLREGYSVQHLKIAVTAARAQKSTWPGYRNIVLVWGAALCSALNGAVALPQMQLAQGNLHALYPHGTDMVKNAEWLQGIQEETAAASEQFLESAKDMVLPTSWTAGAFGSKGGH